MGEPEAVAAEVTAAAEAEAKPAPIDAEPDVPAESAPVEAVEPELPQVPAGVASLFLTGARFVHPFPHPVTGRDHRPYPDDPDADPTHPQLIQIKPERSRVWRTWALTCP